MNYRLKVWLEKDGELIFGGGLVGLLNLIQVHGSIKRAAEEMKMSYRQAWGSIKKAETRLGIQLLVKQVGGESGGGAQLTEEAEAFITKYLGFTKEAEESVGEIFKRHFKD